MIVKKLCGKADTEGQRMKRGNDQEKEITYVNWRSQILIALLPHVELIVIVMIMCMSAVVMLMSFHH